MSRTIAVLALAVGGAATYVWLYRNNKSSDVHSQVEAAINKVRSTFSIGDTRESAGAQALEKAKDLVDGVADRAEEATVLP